jgi:DNA invertase Pin-like site-specific DNA recombinase
MDPRLIGIYSRTSVAACADVQQQRACATNAFAAASRERGKARKVEVYFDIGCCGSVINPQLKRLLADAQLGRLSEVVVIGGPSRLGRSTTRVRAVVLHVVERCDLPLTFLHVSDGHGGDAGGGGRGA